MLVLFKQGTPTCSKIWGRYPTGKANEETRVGFFLSRAGLIREKLQCPYQSDVSLYDFKPNKQP